MVHNHLGWIDEVLSGLAKGNAQSLTQPSWPAVTNFQTGTSFSSSGVAKAKSTLQNTSAMKGSSVSKQRSTCSHPFLVYCHLAVCWEYISASREKGPIDCQPSSREDSTAVGTHWLQLLQAHLCLVRPLRSGTRAGSRSSGSSGVMELWICLDQNGLSLCSGESWVLKQCPLI